MDNTGIIVCSVHRSMGGGCCWSGSTRRGHKVFFFTWDPSWPGFYVCWDSLHNVSNQLPIVFFLARFFNMINSALQAQVGTNDDIRPLTIFFGNPV